MSNDGSLGSISQLLLLLQTQNQPDAARALWQRYFPRLVRLASRVSTNANFMNAEDAVQSAFIQFFESMQRGDFTEPMNRNELWRILSIVTIQKLQKQSRRESALKRGGGRIITASQMPRSGSGSYRVENAVSVRPTAEWDLIFSEMLEMLDGDLRKIALMRLSGYTNPQIKQELGCSLRSVERRVQIIRVTWQDLLEI